MVERLQRGLTLFKNENGLRGCVKFNKLERKVCKMCKSKDTSTLTEKNIDDMIVGSSNEFAHALSLAIIETPDIYNVAYLYGVSGTGKTYMLHAIRKGIIKTHPNKTVCYKTGSEIAEEIQEAASIGIKDLIDKYIKIDVLLLDDIQFLLGRGRSNMEWIFLKILKYMRVNFKQIVVACDRHFSVMETVYPLKIFWEQGIIADLDLPDYEMRKSFLLKKIEQKWKGYTISMEEIDDIAREPETNYFVLEGTLIKMMAKKLINE